MIGQNSVRGISCGFFALTLTAALPFVSGCGDGGGGGSFTPAEKAEVDKYIKEHGREAIGKYLKDKGGDEKRDLKYIKHFVSKGADVNTEVLLRYLGNAENGNINSEVIKFLISKGADVNANVLSVYFLMVENDNVDIEIVKLLVSKGADVNGRMILDDLTPLHCAASNGNVEAVKFLVSKGADMKAKVGGFDYTPLHCAAIEGNVEVVRLLVSKGADVNAKSHGDRTPADVAEGANKDEIIRILRGQ